MANLRVDKITSTETFEKTGSVQFDGSGDRLSVADNAAFGFGSGDFTIEYWIYHAQTGSRCHTFDLRATGAEDSVTAFYNNNTTELRIYFNQSDKMSLLTELQASQWVHHALVRNGDTLTFYQNGIELGSAGVAGESLRTSAPAVIGAKRDGTEVLNGHISNFRIIKGKALYTENFKPPMRELEVTPETVLLACQHKTDASHEKTGKTITVTGNAVASELTPGLLTPVPKAGGGSAITGSVEFDGTGDYLTIPNTEDLRLADSDFTIEFWATISKVDSNSNYSAFALFENSSALRSYQLEVRANGAVRFEWWYNGSGSYDITTGTGAVIVNEWYHYAVSRNGATIKLFINGIEVGSADAGVNAFFNNTVTPFIIGGMFQSAVHEQRWQGNISNLRVVKGTALYTADFIPPTRELKKVPGTVLLCCQDPDSPLTEATGKTITGYGDLRRTDGSELVTNGNFSNGTTGWTISDAGEGSMAVVSGQLVVTNNDTSDPPVYAWQEITTVAGSRYRVEFQLAGGTASSHAIYLNSSSSLGNAYGERATSGTNALAVGALGELEFVAAGTSAYILLRVNANAAATSIFDNISAYAIPHDAAAPASNFTPQVGDDRQITFEGVTKVNSDAYFYLPTGDTASRETTGTYNAGTRGIFGGGFVGPSSGSQRDTIQYINIATTGNAIDAGDLTQARYGNAALASDTRAVWAGGINPSPSYFNTIDAVEIMSTGNAFDFGDLYANVYYPGGVSNRTRGIYAGGYQAPSPAGFRSEIGYITISSKGDSQDFGDMLTAKNSYSTFGSPTRGCFAGGATPSKINSIEYVTIATTGNASDFGDLSQVRNYAGGCGSAIRGLVGGGSTPTAVNTIDYVTISAMGSAADFGDLTSARQEIGSCSSATRGVFAGSWSPAKTNIIDYVTIQTTANAKDFGDLVIIGVMQEMGTSNGHGGLG